MGMLAVGPGGNRRNATQASRRRGTAGPHGSRFGSDHRAARNPHEGDRGFLVDRPATSPSGTATSARAG